MAVVQDTRGAHASEGKYVHYNNDDQDGFDTIQWIVQQPWSNGKVGMWGSSHPGAVQWVAAAGPGPGTRRNRPYRGTQQPLSHSVSGRRAPFGAHCWRGCSHQSAAARNRRATDLTQFHYHLPLTTLDQAIGWPMPWLKGVVAHNRLDGFWRRLEVDS